MPGPVELERPSVLWRAEFLCGVQRSRRLHRSLVHPPNDRAAYDAWLKRLRRPSHEGYLVLDRAESALIGVININEIVRGAFQSGYLGYYAFTPNAGRGLMCEGLRLVLSRAFGELRVHRLEANIQPGNAASIALVKRLGFACEGYSVRYLKIGGRWRDHERWALVRERWHPRRESSNP